MNSTNASRPWRLHEVAGAIRSHFVTSSDHHDLARIFAADQKDEKSLQGIVANALDTFRGQNPTIDCSYSREKKLTSGLPDFLIHCQPRVVLELKHIIRDSDLKAQTDKLLKQLGRHDPEEQLGCCILTSHGRDRASVAGSINRLSSALLSLTEPAGYHRADRLSFPVAVPTIEGKSQLEAVFLGPRPLIWRTDPRYVRVDFVMGFDRGAEQHLLQTLEGSVSGMEWDGEAAVFKVDNLPDFVDRVVAIDLMADITCLADEDDWVGELKRLHDRAFERQRWG